MKRSQRCIFKLSSSTPKSIRVKYVTWHAILTSTTHSHFTAHARQSFLNFKLVKVTPQHTSNSEHTWAMLFSVRRRHSPDLHTVLAPTVAALHVSLTCLSVCPTSADPNAGHSNTPRCYFFRGVSSLKWCPSHSFTALGTVNETTGKCHWDRWPVGSARMEQGAISPEAESRGVRHLRKTKPQSKVHTH